MWCGCCCCVLWVADWLSCRCWYWACHICFVFFLLILCLVLNQVLVIVLAVLCHHCCWSCCCWSCCSVLVSVHRVLVALTQVGHCDSVSWSSWSMLLLLANYFVQCAFGVCWSSSLLLMSRLRTSSSEDLQPALVADMQGKTKMIVKDSRSTMPKFEEFLGSATRSSDRPHVRSLLYWGSRWDSFKNWVWKEL